MTHRKTTRRWVMMSEDAFGAPPAARGSMMNIAGAEDELEPGEELLVDDMPEGAGDYGDDKAMNGPIYAEGRVRTSLRVLRRALQKALAG